MLKILRGLQRSFPCGCEAIELIDEGNVYEWFVRLGGYSLASVVTSVTIRIDFGRELRNFPCVFVVQPRLVGPFIFSGAVCAQEIGMSGWEPSEERIRHLLQTVWFTLDPTRPEITVEVSPASYSRGEHDNGIRHIFSQHPTFNRPAAPPPSEPSPSGGHGGPPAVNERAQPIEVEDAAGFLEALTSAPAPHIMIKKSFDVPSIVSITKPTVIESDSRDLSINLFGVNVSHDLRVIGLTLNATRGTVHVQDKAVLTIEKGSLDVGHGLKATIDATINAQEARIIGSVSVEHRAKATFSGCTLFHFHRHAKTFHFFVCDDGAQLNIENSAFPISLGVLYTFFVGRGALLRISNTRVRARAMKACLYATHANVELRKVDLEAIRCNAIQLFADQCHVRCTEVTLTCERDDEGISSKCVGIDAHQGALFAATGLIIRHFPLAIVAHSSVLHLEDSVSLQDVDTGIRAVGSSLVTARNLRINCDIIAAEIFHGATCRLTSCSLTSNSTVVRAYERAKVIFEDVSVRGDLIMTQVGLAVHTGGTITLHRVKVEQVSIGIACETGGKLTATDVSVSQTNYAVLVDKAGIAEMTACHLNGRNVGLNVRNKAVAEYNGGSISTECNCVEAQSGAELTLQNTEMKSAVGSVVRCSDEANVFCADSVLICGGSDLENAHGFVAMKGTIAEMQRCRVQSCRVGVAALGFSEVTCRECVLEDVLCGILADQSITNVENSTISAIGVCVSARCKSTCLVKDSQREASRQLLSEMSVFEINDSIVMTSNLCVESAMGTGSVVVISNGGKLSQDSISEIGSWQGLARVLRGFCAFMFLLMVAGLVQDLQWQEWIAIINDRIIVHGSLFLLVVVVPFLMFL